MSSIRGRHLVAAILLLLAACAASGNDPQPTVAVMPAPNKPFQVFQEDDIICRNYADQQVAGASQEATSQQVGSAVIGTLLGAGIGAAAGGGRGAAIGAGAGALGGTIVGSGAAERTARTAQQRYDIAYAQCMYSRGNQVPGYGAPANAPPPPPPAR